jgi:hypothetical protein
MKLRVEHTTHTTITSHHITWAWGHRGSERCSSKFSHDTVDNLVRDSHPTVTSSELTWRDNSVFLPRGKHDFLSSLRSHYLVDLTGRYTWSGPPFRSTWYISDEHTHYQIDQIRSAFQVYLIHMYLMSTRTIR